MRFWMFYYEYIGRQDANHNGEADMTDAQAAITAQLTTEALKYVANKNGVSFEAAMMDFLMGNEKLVSDVAKLVEAGMEELAA